MAGPPVSTTLKRKATFESAHAGNLRKRQRLQNDRSIATQRAQAMPDSTELNVNSYIKAREFEIKALEQSMQRARKRLTQRAFQQVPRHMRRRTASHNAKKVPNRLRKRAVREMKDDNTPTVNKKTRTPSRKLRIRLETAKALKKINRRTESVRQKKKDAKINVEANKSDPEDRVAISKVPRVKKNTQANPPIATSKYKRRQIHKTWLPTHMWHTKRAHMTAPTRPLWRMTIPLSPTEKSYRPSHRAAGSRGCVAWDTSFMSTIACVGTDNTLEKLLRALGFHGETWSGEKHTKWRAGSRFAEGWLYERDNDAEAIAPVAIIWVAKAVKADETEKAIEQEVSLPDLAPKTKRGRRIRLDRQLFFRVHPSAFQQLWLEVLKVAKMQKPQVLVEDLRFEIGSIDIMGPGSTESLLGVLQPRVYNKPASILAENTWRSLRGLNNPASLPLRSLLSFNIIDPRLNHPPKTINPIISDGTKVLDDLLVLWPLDHQTTHTKLACQRTRWLAGNRMASQKAINRRRTACLIGQPLAPTKEDPELPVMLLACRGENADNKGQGKWTVLMPWGCVDAVWRSLMYYPLSSGSTPRFGGLQEEQQIAFEKSTPWYPGDFPGTESGKAWARSEDEKRFDEWIRRPPSRRLAWDTVNLGIGRSGELGRGWACDWTYLTSNTDRKCEKQKPTPVPRPVRDSTPKFLTQEKLLTQRQRKAAKILEQAAVEAQNRRRNTSSPESDAESQKDIGIEENRYNHICPPKAISMFKVYKTSVLPLQACLFTVRITLLTRGTPESTARVYRLPSSKPFSSNRSIVVQASVEQMTSDVSMEIPPAAQPSIPVSSVDSQSTNPAMDLRQRWLAHDCGSSGSFKSSLVKIKPNHHGLPKSKIVLPRENLDHVRAIPKNAPPEVVTKFSLPGAPRTDTSIATKSEIVQQALAKELWSTADGKQRTDHVPCPDQHDLIGFVTSGGYNLSQGRGTAIGSLWLQRVIEGWREEDLDDTNKQSQINTQRSKLQDRHRHLCIVRNSGESVGRLGIWEVCP